MKHLGRDPSIPYHIYHTTWLQLHHQDSTLAPARKPPRNQLRPPYSVACREAQTPLATPLKGHCWNAASSNTMEERPSAASLPPRRLLRSLHSYPERLFLPQHIRLLVHPVDLLGDFQVKVVHHHGQGQAHLCPCQRLSDAVAPSNREGLENALAVFPYRFIA